MKELYNDILSIKIDMKDSFETSLCKFYDVMRKHKIYQGTKSENGVSICSAEWCMAFSVFKDHKLRALDVWLILNNPPKDLRFNKDIQKLTPKGTKI